MCLLITFLFAFYAAKKLQKCTHMFLEVTDRSFISSWYERPRHNELSNSYNLSCNISWIQPGIYPKLLKSLSSTSWIPFPFFKFFLFLEIHWNSPEFIILEQLRSENRGIGESQIFITQNIRNCSELNKNILIWWHADILEFLANKTFAVVTYHIGQLLCFNLGKMISCMWNRSAF